MEAVQVITTLNGRTAVVQRIADESIVNMINRQGLIKDDVPNIIGNYYERDYLSGKYYIFEKDFVEKQVVDLASLL